MAGVVLGPREGLGKTAGRDDVVVLDHHGVIEAEAVIAAAARGDRILLQHAQARRGLAGANDLGEGPGCGIDGRCGCGGDPREMAEQIERRSLGRKNGARLTVDARQNLTGLDPLALGHLGFERQAFVQHAERGEGCRKPCDAAVAPGSQQGLRRGAGRDHAVAGDVAASAEILAQRALQDWLDQKPVGKGRRLLRLALRVARHRYVIQRHRAAGLRCLP